MSLELLKEKRDEINKTLCRDFFILLPEIEKYKDWIVVIRELLTKIEEQALQYNKASITWCLFYFLGFVDRQYFTKRFTNVIHSKIKQFENNGFYFGYLLGIDQDYKTLYENLGHPYVRLEFNNVSIEEKSVLPIIKMFENNRLVSYTNGKFLLNNVSHYNTSIYWNLPVIDVLLDLGVMRDDMKLEIVMDNSLSIHIKNDIITFSGSTQSLVNYFLNKFKTNVIQRFDSCFECKNRHIETLFIVNKVRTFEGCKINNYRISRWDKSHLDLCNVFPEEVPHQDGKHPLCTALKVKKLIFYLYDNYLLDTSLFGVINDFIPYVIEKDDVIEENIENGIENEIEHEQEPNYH